MSNVKHTDLQNSWRAFVQNECEDAFYDIYAYYHHYLSYIGVKRGFNLERVEDTINDVFLYLWETKAKNNIISNYHNYIVTIFLRRVFRKNVLTEPLVFVDEISADLSIPSVEDTLIATDITDSVSQLLKEKLDQLGDKQRSVVYQKFYLGLSYEEIAKANNVSIHTVYNTVYKSVDKLRNMLTAEQETFLKIAISALSVFFLIFL